MTLSPRSIPAVSSSICGRRRPTSRRRRQQQIKAEAEAFVALEKARLEVATSEADVKVSELDQRDNQFLGSVQQRKNEIALEQARNRLDQARVDLAHRDAAKQTGVDVQRAAVKEAQTKVDTTRQTIANLTLRAPTSGYVQLAENTNGLSVLFYGMQVPTFQLGDSARPGQIVAQIPDMSSWEVSTQIPETDRAFLAVGQRAIIRPKAMPGQEFAGHISLLGGSAGSAWNRTFNCRIALDDADEDLRPGLSVDVVIRVETLDECPVGPVPGGVRARGTLVRLSTGARGLGLASGHDDPPHREPGRGHRDRSRRDDRPGGTGPADAQHAVSRSARSARQVRILTDLLQAFDNLRAQKTRTLLTTSASSSASARSSG